MEAWGQTWGQLSSHIVSLDPTAELQQDKQIKVVHIRILFCFNTHIRLLLVNVHVWKHVVWWSLTALTATRHRCERAAEKTRRAAPNTTVQTAGASACVIILTHASCASAFAERQSSRVSCTLSRCLHRPPSPDRSWPAPALASCPRGTVTRGNALGQKKIKTVNDHN